MRLLAFLIALAASVAAARASTGAAVPWTAVEAEDMTNNGTVLGPQYTANVVASESSGRKCVRLAATGQYVEFSAPVAANSLVVRYSVPDSPDGAGTDYTLSLYTNGTFVRKISVTSKYSWQYGAYPFANTPASGSPRNFYDEARVIGIPISAGEKVRLQKDADDAASYYVLDLVDLELVPAPLSAPSNSLSVMDYGAGGAGVTDDTTALLNCISAAVAQGKTVWLPAGTYKITGSINLPLNLTIQGAGMWYTTLAGDPALYGTASRRVTLNGNGKNIHLSDFAILGKLNYRNDSEANDGLGGAFGTGSSIRRVWVEHTKTGAWIVNSQGLTVEDCRFRDTLADGINACVGMRSTIITNCTARGTGDDCFALWPATYTGQTYTPGLNVITHCTGQLPYLANGGAIYGGVSNRVEDCLFQDMPYGCGILISTTFPVGANVFSGLTVAQRSDLVRCGGYDPGWGWRAALQLALDNGSLAGVRLDHLVLTNNVSDGLSVVAPGSSVSTGLGTLSNSSMANVAIYNYGLGVSGRHGLWARNDTIGSLVVSNCAVSEVRDDSANFAFSFVTNTVSWTVQAIPANAVFTVDGTNYNSAHVFTWVPGWPHSVDAPTPQAAGDGVQYVWNSWSDSGATAHSFTPVSAGTLTASFTTRYLLVTQVLGGGQAGPASGWFDSGTTLFLNASASNGYHFSGWTGTGTGAYTGPSNQASVVLNGPVTETAVFDPATRIISLSGDLLFGGILVGAVDNRWLTISNAGNSTLTVSNIDYPGGFSGDWSGAILPSGASSLAVTFSPQSAGDYGGNVVVNSDATGGQGTLPVSGTAVSPTGGTPAAPTVIGVLVHGDGSATVTCSTTPGFVYHLEYSADPALGVWNAVPGTWTNAASAAVDFTDPDAGNGALRFYRVASP
ncbi:MAG: glycosyl hydrolase family 28-related protein [Verrucomicrobiota bacterium]